jgi:hypothetical protein
MKDSLNIETLETENKKVFLKQFLVIPKKMLIWISNLWTQKYILNIKEPCHSIEKRILYKMNHIFISIIQNLANYVEKNDESTVYYEDLFNDMTL